ncbi:MAG TPA: ABC transporter substrate-binding protein, partial [Acetobacteraceae bacterium]|nr:ABC transporter substrate-binding protein [Acetobacteraceae bacterium]
MPAPLRLRTAIGPYPHVQALRDGRAASSRVAFDFVEVTPITRAFRRMARSLEFDLCEMAVATLAQAHAYGKPITGLSAVVMRGFHHGALLCRRDSTLDGPRDLAGRRVGVRAWSQTTGVWLRGILQDEYGVDPPSIHWITEEDAHVAEAADPAFVSRAPPGSDLSAMLIAGDIDAGIALRGADPAALRSVIPDAAAAAADWFQRTDIYPVNHALAIRRELLDAHPWLADELMALFVAAKQAAPPPPDVRLPDGDALPYGLSSNSAAIETLTRFAAQQGLVPHAYA